MTYLDPLNYNLSRIFVQLFRDALNEYTYAAELAGLKWSINNSKYGITVSINLLLHFLNVHTIKSIYYYHS